MAAIMKRPVPRVLLLFVAYAVLAAVVLGANPLRDETITPFDVLVTQRAWHWVDPGVEVRQPERTDVLNGVLPNWTNARKQIRDGRFPLWNDEYAGGNSHLLTNNSTYTPGFAIFAATPDPALGFYLAIVFNLAVAGLGMHLFLRRRLSWLAAVVGAVTFEFCGFNAAWLYWPHVFTAIWAPWLLLAVDHCGEKPGLRTGLAIAAATTLLILGGFPFVAEMVLGMAFLYAMTRWFFLARVDGIRRRFASWYVLGTVLAFITCGLLLYELAFYLEQFDLGYRQDRGSYLDPGHMSRLLPPWAYEFKRVEQTMYVGLVLTLLAAASVVLAVARSKRPALLPLFGVILLVVSGGLVFGLWPMWLVGWVPGMAFNSWSRSIILLDISLIMLGATAIDHFWNMGSRHRVKWLHVCLILLGAAQVVEISAFFKRYNGPVDRSYYYPDVPAINYIREHAGPFDYVIADRSFHISGALGAYGLREWFGHQLRTVPLKQVLARMVPDHFSSHTSSRFSAKDIRPDAPEMSAFNVRYLAISSEDASAIGPGIRKIPGHKPLPALPGSNWLQHFRLDDGAMLLSGISVRLATYRRTDLEGTVTLSLLAEDGRVIADSVVDASYLIDNSLCDFYFPRPLHLDAGQYGFTLVYRPREGSPPRLTAWASPDANQDLPLQVDGKPHDGVIEFVLHPGPGRLGRFQRVFTAADISVFENIDSPDGPYFVEYLSWQPGARSSFQVKVEEYSSDRFAIRYVGEAAGYVVVPMSITPDWRVELDGKAVAYALKDGVLPAVPVSGPANIRFHYDPHTLRWLLPWLALLFAALLSVFLIDRHMRQGMPPHGNPS